MKQGSREPACDHCKEALRHELQEHPVLTFNIHQLGGGVSFQHHSFVAFQEGVSSVLMV